MTMACLGDVGLLPSLVSESKSYSPSRQQVRREARSALTGEAVEVGLAVFITFRAIGAKLTNGSPAFLRSK